MKGLVVKSTGNEYEIRQEDGSHTLCQLKGNFRIKGIKSTNPLAVGDQIEYDESGYITKLYPRKNYIVRKPTNLSKQLHIIGTNLDQTILIVTIKQPETALRFIDRFLATAEAYRVPAVLVFNKVDLLDEEDMDYLQALMHLYTSIGYPCYPINALTGEGVDALRDGLAQKVTLLSGNSGVGKSTLINAIFPNMEVKTASISDVHQTGMHTTTFSEMHELQQGGFVIDTPGIKGFGMVNMESEEVSHYFPEIFAQSKACKFANCSHRHEPKCAVKEAVEQHKISESRYESYLSIIEELEEEGPYRK